MANKMVTIGGKDRPIAFGVNFHKEFEKITGLSFLFLEDNRIRSYTALAGITYAALKWGEWDGKNKEPVVEFTQLQVGVWLDENPEAGKIILDSLFDSIPKSKNGVAVANAAP